MTLSNVVKSIQNIMRKDAGVDGDAQRISQLGWMIFLKIFDDREKELEILDPKYKSPIPEDLRWRNWAENSEGITGDELLNFVNNRLFSNDEKVVSLKNLNSTDEKSLLIESVFQDSFNYMKSGTLIRQVVNKLNEIDFNTKKDRHDFNEIYESILKDLQSAGNAGEFYTPRPITQFIIEMLDPKLGDKILDPACGTGGFLTSALQHIRQKYVHSAEDEKLLQQSIHGKELKQLPHLLAVTNMIINGIDIPTTILHTDSLSQPLREYSEKDRVDIIATNPPFGGMIKDGIEKNFPSDFQTKETADLFLVLIVKLLKHNGKCGLVLPDGSLTGGGVKQRIRKHLLDECNLHTIIRLPNSVFQPYASIATNLLFFDKGKATKEIWYYEHRMPEGYKSYSKTKTIQLKEFDLIKEWWNNRIEGEVCWKVPIQTIIDRNYDLDIKNPHKKDVVQDYSSKELIQMLESSFFDSHEKLKQIKETVL